MSAAPIRSARSWRVRRSATCRRFLRSLILRCRQKRFCGRVLLAGGSMPDTTATAYWWAAYVPPAAYPVAVAYNGGVFALGSHTQPVMFTINAVPEPSTWLMVIVGFAAFGWAALQRPRDALRAGQNSGAVVARGRQSAPWRLPNRSTAARIDQ